LSLYEGTQALLAINAVLAALAFSKTIEALPDFSAYSIVAILAGNTGVQSCIQGVVEAFELTFHRSCRNNEVHLGLSEGEERRT
jgi:hypothetical protein